MVRDEIRNNYELQGDWTGATVSFDEFGRPVRLRLDMEISCDGYTTEEAYRDGMLVGRRTYTFYLDKDNSQLYYCEYGTRVNYGYSKNTISTSTITLHKKH